MTERPFLLQPKHELYRRHHERLTTRPDPVKARERFEQRLALMRRFHGVRVVAYVGLYFATIAVGLGFLLKVVGDPYGIGRFLDLLVGLSSSLTAILLAAILLATRMLSWIEVELRFYSEETRMTAYTPPPATSNT